MSSSPEYTHVAVPARIAGLSFTYLRPRDFNPLDLPTDIPDFEQPTAFFPLEVAMASYGAVLFSVGARPAYGDGTVEDWAEFNARESKMQIDSLEPTTFAGMPAIKLEARQQSEMGSMRVRSIFLEDGTRMVNLVIMAPEALWASVEPTLQFTLSSFRLDEERGATAVLTRAAAQKIADEAAALVPPEPAEVPASPAVESTPAAELALADDASTLDPEHPFNVRLRDNGAGLTTRVLDTNVEEKCALIGAGAVEATFRIPFGWHAIDDGKRTLVFDAAGEIQISLNLRRAEGDHRALLGALLAQAESDQPNIDPVFVDFAPDLPGLVLRNYRDGDDVLVQAFVLKQLRDDGLTHVARVTSSPDNMTRAMNLAEMILHSLGTEVAFGRPLIDRHRTRFIAITRLANSLNMDRSLLWIRDNPQLAGVAFFLTVVIGLLAFFATIMIRSGISLRPLIWFAGFFAIVAGPQAVVHLMDGLTMRRAALSSPTSTSEPSRSAQTSAPTLQPVPWEIVFGPKADPTLISDAKRGLDAILGEAIEAKLSFNVDGETALAARFPTAKAASQALNVYGSFFAFAQARGSDETGWTARRHGGQGEWVHVVSAGTELYAWTSASRESVLANRARAIGPITESPYVDSSKPNPDLVITRLRARLGFTMGLVSINLLVAVLWFFKGSAWSARIDAHEGIRPTSAETLRHSLLAINQTDVPTDVSVREDGSVQVDWRYADARWFDLMRVHQLKRTQRLVLILDEPNRTVRVREYWSSFDASAGAGDLRLAWKMQTGIQFFNFEHKRVIGVQLSPDGKPTGELSQAYTFNLQALKSPIIEQVTRAGWTWQPLTWNAPKPLRWLTE